MGERAAVRKMLENQHVLQQLAEGHEHAERLDALQHALRLLNGEKTVSA
jgi:hypothetical protein